MKNAEYNNLKIGAYSNSIYYFWLAELRSARPWNTNLIN